MNGEVFFGKVKILFCLSVMMCILCLDFVSCKNKSVSAGYKNKNTPAKEFVFSITDYAFSGSECEYQKPEKYYVSKNAINFLMCQYPNKGKMTVNADVYFPYKRGLLESHGFYVAQSDSGDWIEDCLIAYEEERLAKVFEESIEIESPVEGFDDYDFLTDYDDGEHIDLSEDVVIENEFSDVEFESEDEEIVSVEKRLLDSKARLRMLSFEDEIFIPEERVGEQVLISSDGKKVRRSFYDNKYRLLKREHWIISGLNDSVIVRTENYKYNDEILSPLEKSIQTDDSKIKTYFNLDGTACKSENYKYKVLKNDGDKTDERTEEKIEYLSSTVEWKYNSDGKIISESTAAYEYKNDNYSKPSKIYRKRQTYKYHDDDEIPPDYAYYEDGELRIKTIYTSKDEYRTDTFFESGYTISAYYKDSKKVREVYYQNGAAVRTKNYE